MNCMRYKFLGLSAAFVAAGLVTAEAATKSPAPLSIKSSIEKEVVTIDAEGRRTTTLVAVGKVWPGETLVYTYRLTNAGAIPAQPVVLSTPIPAHMTYKGKSAATAGVAVSFSVDGGKTFAEADKLEAVMAGGQRRRAEAGDYTHIRWRLSAPLEGGASQQVAFRATLQ
jgi:uncharacterized repeat protein (TIGR01451 family)